MTDPRVEVVYDDARNFIRTTKEKFDVITSDPINPWVKGAAALYTREYFDLVKQHLNPRGVVSQWAPLYETSLPAVKSEFATFFEAFPHGTVWSSDLFGVGYDTVLLGKVGAPEIMVDELDHRLRRPDQARVAQSLREVEFKSVADLLATFAGRDSDLVPWLDGAEINRDRNLRLQYLAGVGMNFDTNPQIFSSMLVYRRFPSDLFIASEETKQALRIAFATPAALPSANLRLR